MKASRPKSVRRPSVRFAESEQTIFSIEDDQDQVEESDLGGAREERGVSASAKLRQVTLEDVTDDGVTEQLPLYRPPYGLKSTQSSREAEFEADDSDVEVYGAEAILSSPTEEMQRNRPRSLSLLDRIPTLPLVVDRARQSISDGAGHNLRESLRNAMESEELPDWLRRGAGILDSTWNMSNSILGAGVVGEFLQPFTIAARR
jgi:hypothetical protein